MKLSVKKLHLKGINLHCEIEVVTVDSVLEDVSPKEEGRRRERIAQV